MSISERNPLEIRTFRVEDQPGLTHTILIPPCWSHAAIKEVLASMVPEGNRKGILYISAETGNHVPIHPGQLNEMRLWPIEERRDMLNIMAMRIKTSPFALIIERR